MKQWFSYFLQDFLHFVSPFSSFNAFPDLRYFLCSLIPGCDALEIICPVFLFIWLITLQISFSPSELPLHTLLVTVHTPFV